MSKLKYILLFLTIAFISCQSPKQQENVDEYSLRHQLLLGDEYLIGKVKSLALINDTIPVIINSRNDSKEAFAILDYPRKRITKYGDWGQGPDEYLFPTSIQTYHDSIFSFWDINKKRYSSMQTISMDSFIVNHSFCEKDSFFHFEVLPICNSQYIATGIYDNYRLTILDEQGRFKQGVGECPNRDDKEKKVSGRIRSEIYQGKLSVSPKGNKLVHALLRANIISFYNVTDEDKVCLISEQINSYPQYSYHTGTMTSNAPIYCLDVCSTEQYIYVLYSGRNYKESKDKAFLANKIKVYDWNGKLAKVFYLDIDIKVMNVTQDDKKIYAIAYLPNPVLVSFDISQ